MERRRSQSMVRYTCRSELRGCTPLSSWILINLWIEGDVAYMEALGRPMVVLNSYSAAHDLFAKRSSLYSDRPRFPVGGELYGVLLQNADMSF